jgi:hypothetical protein
MSQLSDSSFAVADSSCQFTSAQFLLRIGGLPLDTVDGLGLLESKKWAAEVLELDGQLEQKKDGVIELLHTIIQAHADNPQAQRVLIGFKRDVFNLRPPKGSGKVLATIAPLDVEARGPIVDWLETITRRRELLVKGTRLVEDEIESKRSLLKSIVKDESFRSGLLIASPTLEKELDHYLRAPNKNLNRRLRLTERALLLYLFRTACKTSPFSSFGVVAAGRIDSNLPADQSGDSYETPQLNKRSYVRPNVAFLSRLTAALLSDENILRELPLSLKAGWEISGDRVRYLRRIHTLGEQSTGPIIDNIKESVFFLPLSPTLRRLILFISDRDECSLSEISHALSTLEEQNDPAQIEEFLIHLVRLDLLVVRGLQPSPYQGDIFSQYRERLAELNTPVTKRLCARLEKIEALTDSYSVSSLNERREISSQIEHEMRESYLLVGASQESLPKTLLYEDVTVNPPSLVISAQRWQRFEDGLKDIHRILPIFEQTIGARFVMNAFFKIIYGVGQRCDDVLSFAEVFTQDYYSEYSRAAMRRTQFDSEGKLTPSLNHFNIAEIKLLDQLRQEFAEYIGGELAGLRPDSYEMILPRASFRSFAARIPENLSRLSANSFFTQIAVSEEETLLVINRIYAGLTQMFSRFIYPLDNHGVSGLARELSEMLEFIQPSGAVFAEFQGGRDTNLNLHPLLTRYEIICPGEQKAAPPAEQIYLNDLYIEHNPATDTLHLFSKSLGKEVIPLYLGFLMPMALPQLRQILINFSYPSFSYPYFWEGVTTGPKVGKTFAFYPRIRYGDIVVQRALWKIASEFLPRRTPMQTDSDYFLTVKRWQQQCRLPQRVFVTPDMLPIGADAQIDVEPAAEPDEKRKPDFDDLMRKPMFVDFDNIFSVTLLERAILKSRARMVMSEMLPDRDQQWLKHNGRASVTEFIFELNQLQGRRL